MPVDRSTERGAGWCQAWSRIDTPRPRVGRRSSRRRPAGSACQNDAPRLHALHATPPACRHGGASTPTRPAGGILAPHGRRRVGDLRTSRSKNLDRDPPAGFELRDQENAGRSSVDDPGQELQKRKTAGAPGADRECSPGDPSGGVGRRGSMGPVLSVGRWSGRFPIRPGLSLDPGRRGDPERRRRGEREGFSSFPIFRIPRSPFPPYSPPLSPPPRAGGRLGGLWWRGGGHGV